MEIEKTYTSSFMQQKSGIVYDAVVSGKIVEITNRSRPDMVLMTKADFLKMAKQIKEAEKC